MIEQLKKLPQFEVTLGNGSIVDENFFLNKNTVLFFYPRDDTPGCTKEAINFSNLKESFSNLGIEIYGISKDNQNSHENFITKYNLLVDLLFDHNGLMCEAFGVWKEKQMYGKTYSGIERSTFLINKCGKVMKSWRKVKVDGHVEEVLSCAKLL
jgi:peroxiredoxin Q/BCP